MVRGTPPPSPAAPPLIHVYTGLTLPTPRFSSFWDHIGNSGHREEVTSPGSHSQDQSQERSPIFLAPSMFVCLKGFFCVFLFLLSYCMLKVQKVQKSHQKCIHKHLPISFFFFFTKCQNPMHVAPFLSLDHLFWGSSLPAL